MRVVGDTRLAGKDRTHGLDGAFSVTDLFIFRLLALLTLAGVCL